MNENRCCEVVERLTKAERDEMRDPAWRPEHRVWQELLRCLDELDARDLECCQCDGKGYVIAAEFEAVIYQG